MIDYEKLKIAHELAYESESYYFEISLGVKDGLISLYDANNNSEQFINNYECLDELISKLKELTHDVPKYKTAWYMHNGQIKSTEVLNQVGYLFCDKSDYQSMGRIMHPTREALIESQISYWNNLKQELNDNIEDATEKVCQHQDDGFIYYSNTPQNRCKKCGEYYR